MRIYVQIYDNDKAFTTYDIEQHIIVIPNVSYLQAIKEYLILADSTFSVNKILNEGDYLQSLQLLQSLSSLINEQSLSDQFGLILSEIDEIKIPKKYGPISNYKGVTPVS
jgi:hypothetical protein